MTYTLTAFNGQTAAVNLSFADLLDTLHLAMQAGINDGAYTIRNAFGKIIFADCAIKDLFFLLAFHPIGLECQGEG